MIFYPWSLMICTTFISMTDLIFLSPGILRWILDRRSLLEYIYIYIFFALTINDFMSILQTWIYDEVIQRLDLFFSTISNHKAWRFDCAGHNSECFSNFRWIRWRNLLTIWAWISRIVLQLLLRCSLNIDMNMILSQNRSGSTFWHRKSFWISY